MSYLAEVHTSNVHGAGTDADVSIMLFGDLGDSGLQPLNVSCMALSDGSQLLYSSRCDTIGHVALSRVYKPALALHLQ